MGTIASVLQWQCENCNTINPIECVRCCGCDTVRLLNEEETSLEEDEDPGKKENFKSTDDAAKDPCTKELDCASQQLYRDIKETLLATKEKGEGLEPKKKPQPTGYLEIQPDG